MPENGSPIDQDTVGGIRSAGRRGAGWRSFSGCEGNDKAIVKRIFIRELGEIRGRTIKEREGPGDLPESLSKNTPTGRRSGLVGETAPSLGGVPSQSIVRLLKTPICGVALTRSRVKHRAGLLRRTS